MGDDGGKDVHEGIGDIMVAMRKYFPEMTSFLNDAEKSSAKTEADITQEYSPRYAQTAANIFADQGKQLAKTGREIYADDTKASGENELALATGSGAKLAEQALKLQKIADPEYFSNRTALSDNIGKMMSAIDPNKLSAGETEQIARGLGRTNYTVGSPMQDIGSAMTFGDALSKRREEYGRAVDRRSAAMPQLRSGINMLGAATQRATPQINTGLSQLPGLQTPGVTTGNNAMAGFMNPAGMAMGINMNKQASDWDKYNQGANAVGNTIGQVVKIASMVAGCWVAREVYGENDARWIIFRSWLSLDAPRWLFRTYNKYGERFANWLRRHTWAKPPIRALMNIVVEK